MYIETLNEDVCAFVIFGMPRGGGRMKINVIAYWKDSDNSITSIDQIKPKCLKEIKAWATYCAKGYLRTGARILFRKTEIEVGKNNLCFVYHFK